MSLKMLSSVAIVLACVALSAADTVGAPVLTVADQSLMNYLMKSSMRDSSNPAACFAYYLPVLQDIANRLEFRYLECATTEASERTRLDDAASSDRYEIEVAADGVCTRLDSCNSYSDALGYFDCISGQGTNNSRTLYEVTQNSSALGGALREQYRILEVQTVKCQNASERAYVEETGACYSDLDTCLKTGYISSTTPITPTTSDVTDSSTESSTAEPTSTNDAGVDSTTTESPTTAQPEDASVHGRSLRVLPHLRKHVP